MLGRLKDDEKSQSMSNFSMGTISGMGFAKALVHTVHSTCAFGTRAMNCMHLCLCKTHSRDCPHAEIRHLPRPFQFHDKLCKAMNRQCGTSPSTSFHKVCGIRNCIEDIFVNCPRHNWPWNKFRIGIVCQVGHGFDTFCLL